MIGNFELRVNYYVEAAKVRCRVKWRRDGNTCEFQVNLPLHVDVAKWSKETMRCKTNSFHFGVSASEINKELNSCEDIAKNIFLQHAYNISAHEFNNEFRLAIGKGGKTSSNGDGTLFDALDVFITKESRQWAENTRKKFVTFRNFLKTHHPRLQFSDITQDFFDTFISNQIKIGYKNVTIRKNTTLLKWFLRWADANHYCNCNTQSFKYKFKGTDGNFNLVVYLTWEELQSMYHHDFSYNKQYDRVRDVFCFCCFTSLRYSDISKLQWCDVTDKSISIITQKTSEPLIIELNDYSRALLDKYRNWTSEEGNFKGKKRDTVFPIISNQKMNKYLKDIAQAIGLDQYLKNVYFIGNERHEEVRRKWEMITTHCGRRTFIVNAMYLGIPAEVVMKWTGHADYKSMKPYIAIVDKLKEASMELFNKK